MIPAPTVLAAPDIDVLSAVLTGAVVAAIVGAVVNIALARRRSREEERERVRSTFAEAFQVVAEYKEFPYVIRRRRPDTPEAERIRISEALREVQVRISYYLAWTTFESADVGRTYDELVTQLRRVAGSACHDAWLAAPAAKDEDMNFADRPIDLSALKPHEDAFVAAARQHVNSIGKVQVRRALRRRHPA
jgi:hypothetical protein